MDRNFTELLDDVCTDLLIGELWHGRAADQYRKIALRGFARWAECEALGDAKCRIALSKLLIDKCGYSPIIDVSNLHDSISFEYDNVSQLRKLLETWMLREQDLAKRLTPVMKMASEYDIEIYRELMRLTDEVQQEAFRVKMVGMRLEGAQWDLHDIYVVNKHLHDWFESNPDSKTLDFSV